MVGGHRGLIEGALASVVSTESKAVVIPESHFPRTLSGSESAWMLNEDDWCSKHGGKRNMAPDNVPFPQPWFFPGAEMEGFMTGLEVAITLN